MKNKKQLPGEEFTNREQFQGGPNLPKTHEQNQDGEDASAKAGYISGNLYILKIKSTQSFLFIDCLD
ncbi:hypothetical protein FBD94_07340 [Pedobacter hiemivivus]|uniref:Uncharacterized protein n=1 Tax=Pedobacter hiemivivus TaxID=2530454 RepID=A0A4U1GKG9_9SPHI|nr:hypothetical protein [Pedobacter hiemivivus]TKC62042.1 hypothetical protein FBD94_07340 [Pedobacter hiemivivus]